MVEDGRITGLRARDRATELTRDACHQVVGGSHFLLMAKGKKLEAGLGAQAALLPLAAGGAGSWVPVGLRSCSGCHSHTHSLLALLSNATPA